MKKINNHLEVMQGMTIIVLAAIIGFSMISCSNSNSSSVSNSNSNGNGDNLIFSDNFNGNSLDTTKWDYCPNWDRQDRSTWSDDMVSVSGGYLRIKFRRDAELGAAKSDEPEIAANWIRSGGIRTRKKAGAMLFENSFGYYEASIKFPKISGTWGAFWLMSPTVDIDLTNGGEEGTEIDIVETIHNEDGKFNAALHWNGYGEHHQSVGSDDNYKSIPVNIYDGEFHTFALHWTPSEYIFYVDGHVLWRVNGGSNFKNSGINQNPNYIKLTV